MEPQERNLLIIGGLGVAAVVLLIRRNGGTQVITVGGGSDNAAALQAQAATEQARQSMVGQITAAFLGEKAQEAQIGGQVAISSAQANRDVQIAGINAGRDVALGSLSADVTRQANAISGQEAAYRHQEAMTSLALQEPLAKLASTTQIQVANTKGTQALALIKEQNASALAITQAKAQQAASQAAQAAHVQESANSSNLAVAGVQALGQVVSAVLSPMSDVASLFGF